MNALRLRRFPNGQQIPVPQLIAQILSGHRLWALAAQEGERFIALQRIQFFENRRTKQVWLRMYLFADDVKRLGYTQNDTLSHSGFGADFQKVKCDEKVEGRPLICFEQTNASTYGRHGVDFANELVAKVKARLWATVGSSSPYRRYYLYLCPPGEQPSLMPQIASIYALTFYFGSVTRYRPNAFQEILNGGFGPRVSEFVVGQPAQFVYLMASEFARRDVTRPSIV